jgi:hypothetical protein
VLAVITACAPPMRRVDVDPPPEPPPTEVHVDLEVTSPPPTEGGAETAIRATRDQPPEVKLRLGHYTNRSRGIGVIIDRTSELSPKAFKVAKLRYDGADAIQVLDPLPGADHRIDYLARGKVVLHVYSDGRAAIYVDSDGPIALHRDGDADPL